MSLRYVVCGVPKDKCNGRHEMLSHSIDDEVKCHSNHLEAFNCHKKYLLSRGFNKIGSREFKDPDDGYVRVLTKKSRFGVRLRGGKKGETETRRGMPDGMTGGIIISC